MAANGNDTSIVKRERRPWNKLCREILLERPYQHRPGSKESGAAWGNVTNELAKMDGFCFATKAIRDHYNGLQATRRAEVAGEKRLSGVNIELNELQIALDELFDDTQKEKELSVGRDEEKKKNEDNEKAMAEEVRKIAIETHGQSKKRESEQGEDADIKSPSLKRRTGAETLRFLMEKNKLMKKEHEDTIELKKKELALRQSEVDNTKNTMGALINTVQTQMQGN